MPLFHAAVLSLGLLGAGCGEPPPCARCETLVIAAAAEPSGLLPPLVGETVGRDVSDLIFERLANLPAEAPPMDSSAYRPGLASRWERVDSLTLRFHLRPDARWHDSVPVTASDVEFSFHAYGDTALGGPARAALAGRVTAAAADDSTVLVQFREVDPEQWYLATWFVRILPRHLWDSIPRARWEGDTLVSRLLGSGPYRLDRWVKGQSLTLERAWSGPSAPEIRRVVWRFGGGGEATLNLLLTHEADLLESVGDSSRVKRVSDDPALTTLPYPSAVFGFLGFNLGPGSSPVRAREVRRALALAIDRQAAARAVLGPGVAVPPGPMSRILWIFDVGTTVTPYDTGAANATLDSAGWRRGSDGMRSRGGGRALGVDILVPGTSLARRNLAQVLQEMWRKVGVKATVTTVDFPVFQERLRGGRFETYIGAQLDEPSPHNLADQWTAAGIGTLNYSRYRNPVFDSLFYRAARFRGPIGDARGAWREALDTLNADVPAIWLYTPTNVAGVAKRVEGVTINPYSWLSGLPEWRLKER